MGFSHLHVSSLKLSDRCQINLVLTGPHQKMKMAVFWVAAPCSLVEFTDVSKVLATSIIRTSTRLHGATTKKTAVFILTAVRTSNPTHPKLFDKFNCGYYWPNRIPTLHEAQINIYWLSQTLITQNIKNYLTNSTEQSPSWQVDSMFSYSRNFPHFMEPEGSLPYSQERANSPYPEPDEPKPQPQTLFPQDTFEYYPPIHA
jgi:hypothetical protein